MLLGEPVPDTRTFYRRRVMRIVPSYFFVTLMMLFVVALPYQLYWNKASMWRDIIAHLTFTQTFNYATYIGTPIGVASWTIAIEMQAYLIFPWLAKAVRRHPWGVMASMAAAALAFRCWCLWRMTDFNMVVNQLINFLDVYALGMAAALLYVKLTTLYPEEKRQKALWQGIATALVALSLWGLVQALRAQAGSVGTLGIQGGQMVRRPLFGSLLAILAVSLPFAVRPIRFLMGNRVMGFLALISMNYYLVHQNVAVHLKRLGIPPSLSETPHFDGEQPWMTQYTFLCFGVSVAMAVGVTFLVEKPGAWLLQKIFNKIDERKKA